MIRSHRFICRPALLSLTLLAMIFSGSPLAAQGDATDEAQMKPYKEKLGKWLEMVPIKGGKVVMGSPATEKERQDHEGPQFTVEIEPFWMGKFEITWDDFALFQAEYDEEAVKNKNWTIPKDREADAVSIPTQVWGQEFTPILNPMGTKGGYPAADMSQFNAAQFTKWLSKKTGRFYRLPTEAEWEYAARAGSKTAYYWGDDPAHLEKAAWFFDNSSYEDPLKQGYPRDNDYYSAGTGYRIVGKLEANPWGLHDMYGNVAEWVIDGYAADHYAKFAGKTVSWKDAIRWPEKSTYPTVYRGGDFTAYPEGCRSASRVASDMKTLQDKDPNLPKSPWWYSDAFHIGFRVIRPLKEPSEEEKTRFWDHGMKLREVVSTYQDKNTALKQYRKVIEPMTEDGQ